jgi:hypothetical protein
MNLRVPLNMHFSSVEFDKRKKSGGAELRKVGMQST